MSKLWPISKFLHMDFNKDYIERRGDNNSLTFFLWKKQNNNHATYEEIQDDRANKLKFQVTAFQMRKRILSLSVKAYQGRKLDHFCFDTQVLSKLRLWNGKASKEKTRRFNRCWVRVKLWNHNNKPNFQSFSKWSHEITSIGNSHSIHFT